MKDAVYGGLGAAALAFVAVVLAVGIQSGADAPVASAQVEHDSGRAVFARMGCGSCHTLADAGSTGQIGPDLDTRLDGHTRATLIARITAPPNGGFSMMPTDFGSRMDARELDSLVAFLLAAREGN